MFMDSVPLLQTTKLVPNIAHHRDSIPNQTIGIRNTDIILKDYFSSEEGMLEEFIFPVDEEIMEAMHLDVSPWDNLHHRSSFTSTNVHSPNLVSQ